jgi:hypothetical protein
MQGDQKRRELSSSRFGDCSRGILLVVFAKDKITDNTSATHDEHCRAQSASKVRYRVSDFLSGAPNGCLIGSIGSICFTLQVSHGGLCGRGRSEHRILS